MQRNLDFVSSTARVACLLAAWAAGIQLAMHAQSVGDDAQTVQGVREGHDERLPSELRAKLEARAPGSDGWGTESIHAELVEQHAALERWLRESWRTTEDAESPDWLAADVRFTLPRALVADDLGEEPSRGGWTIMRWGEPAEPSSAPALDRGDEGHGAPGEGRGVAALRAALAELFPAGRLERFELATYEIAEEGPRRFVEQARLHAASTPDGEDGWELTATWRGTWRRSAPGDRLRLVELSVSGVRAVGARTSWFVDRTREVVGATSAFRDELSHGISYWRRRLDTRLDLPILGHPAGVALGDVDGDGLEDLFVTQPGGLANRLFLHRPDGALVDVSARAAVDHLDFSRGALLADFDRDGDRDLAVVLRSELVLFSNRLIEEAQLVFEPVARFSVPNATSLSAADYDLDGDLDLYVCCYFLPYDNGADAAFPLPYHDARNGARNFFFVNEGGWELRDATDEVGLGQNNDRFSFAAAWEDYDDDGDGDLYVANDFGRNNLYRNDGGTFVDVAAAAGVEDLAAGMGVAWGDVNRDGRMDLYVSNMYSSAGKRVSAQERFHAGARPPERQELRRHALGNTLFLNRGDGTFRDATQEAGVAMGRWSWGSVLLDFDNDGRLDVFVPNGFLTAESEDDL